MFGLGRVKLGMTFQLENGSHADTEYFRNEVLPKLKGEIKKQVLPDMSVQYHVGLRDGMTVNSMMTKYAKEHQID